MSTIPLRLLPLSRFSRCSPLASRSPSPTFFPPAPTSTCPPSLLTGRQDRRMRCRAIRRSSPSSSRPSASRPTRSAPSRLSPRVAAGGPEPTLRSSRRPSTCGREQTLTAVRSPPLVLSLSPPFTDARAGCRRSLDRVGTLRSDHLWPLKPVPPVPARQVAPLVVRRRSRRRRPPDGWLGRALLCLAGHHRWVRRRIVRALPHAGLTAPPLLSLATSISSPSSRSPLPSSPQRSVRRHLCLLSGEAARLTKRARSQTRCLA